MSCPYCDNPERYDLRPGVEMTVLSTHYEDDENGMSRRRVDQDVVRVAHLSRHPIACQPKWHIPCQAV
jgi:hypothetical protein